MHHEQDMRCMGGIRKYMPITYAVMTIGTIAITGLGIPNLHLGFAGFYSKDAIIEAAWEVGAHNAVALFAFFTALFVAGLTAFYSWRLVFMTFEGTPKWADPATAHVEDDHASAAQCETHSEPDISGDHAHDHKPHESPWVMLAPLFVLSIGAIFAGGLFAHDFIGADQGAFWRGAIFHLKAPEEAAHLPAWVTWSPLAVSVLGLLIAAYYYVLHEGLAKRIAERAGPLYIFFYNKWFFDEIYDFVFVRGAKGLGDLFWKVGDQKLIDGLGPNGAAWAALRAARRLVRIQTGYVYHYAFVMLLGVVGLLTYAFSLSR
jgi:NADH-quinone oxidoreductase subunit L